MDNLETRASARAKREGLCGELSWMGDQLGWGICLSKADHLPKHPHFFTRLLDLLEKTEKPENIVLTYRLQIRYIAAGEHFVYYCSNGAEFFIDEHGIQWVKFVPQNGYEAGREHMMRTDANGFLVVRELS